MREKLLEAKREMEKRYAFKFSKDSLALADLISELTAIKVMSQLNQEIPVKASPQTGFGESVGHQSEDSLYGD